jgi:hypothetical protein
VGDINRMAEAFGRGASPDDLMIASWEDLQAIRYVYLFCRYAFNEYLCCRDIVNDVCKWAYTTTVWRALADDARLEVDD